MREERRKAFLPERSCILFAAIARRKDAERALVDFSKSISRKVTGYVVWLIEPLDEMCYSFVARMMALNPFRVSRISINKMPQLFDHVKSPEMTRK